MWTLTTLPLAVTLARSVRGSDRPDAGLPDLAGTVGTDALCISRSNTISIRRRGVCNWREASAGWAALLGCSYQDRIAAACSNQDVPQMAVHLPFNTI